MILRLVAADFGKFRGRVFELGPVTVVHGPNEAGKTTFFDALFQALCRPRESTVAGKRLKARYGAGRKAEVSLAGPLSIDEDEFLNLCAIRAGDLELALAHGTPWLEALKAGLFHGGVDPAALAEEFARRVSDNRTYLHNKELEELRRKAAAAREELDRRRREREALLAEDGSLESLEARLSALRERRRREGAELQEARAALAFEEKIGRRRALAARLARLEETEGLRARLAELAPFAEDRRGEWEALDEAARAAADRLRAARARRDLQAEIAAKAKAECRAREAELEHQQARAALARSIASDSRRVRETAARGARAPGWTYGLDLLLLALAFALTRFLSGPAGVAVMAAALLLAAALPFLAGRLAARRAEEAARQALAGHKDRFAVGTLELATRFGHAEEGPSGDAALLAGVSTLEGLASALERLAVEAESRAGQVHAARRAAEEMEEKGRELEAELAACEGAEAEARRAAQDWLARRGVSGPEDYFRKTARHAEIQAELALRADGNGGDLDSVAEERRELARRLKDLDEEGVPAKGMDEAALQRLRKRIAELESRREEAEREERELIARREGQAGEIRGALGKLAGEIVRAEDDLARLEAQVEARELDKRAAGVALEIFREIGEGADLLLAGLAQELAAMLAHVLPDDRSVSLQGLDTRQIVVADAAGGERPLDSLSSGTRDAVVLAAKLALAVKSRGREGGVLVLDDPFLAMDPEREARALRMLQAFRSRHGWQLILLTKDLRVKEAMGRLFPDLQAIDL